MTKAELDARVIAEVCLPAHLHVVIGLPQVSELGAKAFVEQFVKPQSARFGVGRHFAKHNHGAVSILVPHEIGAAVPITFFAPKNVERRFL